MASGGGPNATVPAEARQLSVSSDSATSFVSSAQASRLYVQEQGGFEREPTEAVRE